MDRFTDFQDLTQAIEFVDTDWSALPEAHTVATLSGDREEIWDVMGTSPRPTSLARRA